MPTLNGEPREVALHYAVEHATLNDTPDDVVVAAEKFHAFLTEGN